MSADLLAILVRAGLAASAAIVIVLLLRRPLRSLFGARIAYAFWLTVPAATAAAFLPARTIFMEAPASAGGAALQIAPQVISAPSVLPQAAMAIDFAALLVALWALGAGFSLAALLRNQRNYLRRAQATRESGGLYRAAASDVGPALIGTMRPRIVVPADFEARYSPVERDLVIAHERAHLHAGDAQVNALAALIQCLNWYNPLFYVARACLRVDQEMACDERVMQSHAALRRVYAEAMLKAQFATDPAPLGCHWPALGMKPLRQRIAMLARPNVPHQKRIVGGIACGVAVVAMAAAAWAAQPPQVAFASPERPLRGDLRAGELGRNLVEAIQEGDIARAEALIEAGADVNRFQRGDGTPLIAAVRISADDLARRLIEAGADVNGAAPGDANPLIVASTQNDVALVTLLIERGADVNGYVPDDETPLINAARTNALGAARTLIDHGADVNLAFDVQTLRGTERRSPIQMARRGGHAEMIALLREHGAQN